MFARGLTIALILTSAGCGRVGFDALDPGGANPGSEDASLDASAATDGGSDAARGDGSTGDGSALLDAAAEDASSGLDSGSDAAMADATAMDAEMEDSGAPDSGSNCPVPVAHWELDENGGTTAIDRISSENAVAQGAVTLSPAAGVVGGAAEFVGTGALNAAFIDNLPTGDFTWAAWIRPDNLGNRVALSIGSAIDGSISYLKWSSDADAEFRVNDVLVINGAAGFSADSTWQHAAVTRVGSTITLYRNGSAIDTGTNGAPLDFASCVFRIGGGTNCAGTGNFQLWTGGIDDVRIYDRAIPAAEVMRLATLAPCP